MRTARRASTKQERAPVAPLSSHHNATSGSPLRHRWVRRRSFTRVQRERHARRAGRSSNACLQPGTEASKMQKLGLAFARMLGYYYKSLLMKHSDARAWRNWQTRTVQVRMGATPWRFKSSRPHHLKLGASAIAEVFYFPHNRYSPFAIHPARSDLCVRQWRGQGVREEFACIPTNSCIVRHTI